MPEAARPVRSPEITGSVHLRGSGTLLRPMQLAAEAFMDSHPGVAVTVAGGGTVRGIRAVIAGTDDVAMASAALDAAQQRHASQQGVTLQSHVVAHDAVAVVVHPGNPVKGLSLQQIRSIFVGDIVNWKEVGGPALPIVVMAYVTGSGTQEAWQDLVLGDAPMAPGALPFEGGPRARVAQTRGAIGYVAHTGIDASVVALAVDGVRLTEKTLKSGAYPLWRSLSLITRDKPSTATADFIRFMLDPHAGQGILAKAGNVPVD